MGEHNALSVSADRNSVHRLYKLPPVASLALMGGLAQGRLQGSNLRGHKTSLCAGLEAIVSASLPHRYSQEQFIVLPKLLNYLIDFELLSRFALPEADVRKKKINKKSPCGYPEQTLVQHDTHVQ